MASLEGKELSPFAIHLGAEQHSANSQTPSTSSSVSLLLNTMSSLTCNETGSKDHAGLHNPRQPLSQKKVKNIQPPNTRVGSVSKVSMQ